MISLLSNIYQRIMDLIPCKVIWSQYFHLPLVSIFISCHVIVPISNSFPLSILDSIRSLQSQHRRSSNDSISWQIIHYLAWDWHNNKVYVRFKPMKSLLIPSAVSVKVIFQFNIEVFLYLFFLSNHYLYSPLHYSIVIAKLSSSLPKL